MDRRFNPGLVIGLCATILLVGCEAGEGPAFLSPKPTGTQTTTSADGSTRTVERDREAPEVFQVADKGLWDGRPSLGGVWVAHPDARDPERVIIRNEANSKFVVGVLYRPERMQPGPRFQVSSDAADALGMLAGQPSGLNVIALRREEVVDEPAETQVAEAPAPKAPPAAQVADAETVDPVALASAALDEVEADDATPETEAKKPGFLASLFGQKDAVDEGLDEGSVTNASASTTTTALPPAPEVTSAPSTSVATMVAATTPVSASTLAKPYIQIGIFSVQNNANNTSESLRRAGMVPTIKPGKMKGKDFWRVIVGPAGSGSERAQLLKKIRELGFTDAYYVTN